MVRRFWRAMIGLWVTGIVFTGLSWLYVWVGHISEKGTSGVAALLTLPTGFPSLWTIVSATRNLASGTALAILLFLAVQVVLTGGLYGTLARVNTGQPASASTFFSDAGRAFPRLLVWNLLWFIAQAVLVSLGAGSSASAATSLAVVMLLLRFVFLFADVALVCERQSTFYASLGLAIRTLGANFWRSVPTAAALAIITGCAVALTKGHTGFTALLAGLLYSVAAIWTIHMIASRYLVFSGWQSRVD